MADYEKGNVHINFPEGFTLDERAGTLDVKEVQRLEKARDGLAEACAKSATGMRDNDGRIAVPQLTADELAAKGQATFNIGNTVANLETALRVFKQQQLITEADAHEALRRVLAAVRAAEKFDPRITDAFPDLIKYFDNASPAKSTGT